MKKIILTAALVIASMTSMPILASDAPANPSNKKVNTPMTEFEGLNLTQSQLQKLYEAAVDREEAMDENVSTIECGAFAQNNWRAVQEAQVAFLSQVQSILTEAQYQQYIDSMPLAVQIVLSD